MTQPDGWKPRRRGTIYCSPLCGAGCTHAAFTRATRNARALAKRLGPGWRPKVWENMNWFYSAEKGVVEVHASENVGRKPCYRAYFNTVHQVVSGTCTLPEIALKQVLDGVRLVRRKLNHDLREVVT